MAPKLFPVFADNIKVSGDQVRHILQLAAVELERNPNSRNAIRQCQQSDPDAFLIEGIKVLAEADDAPGYRFIALLILRMPSLYQELTGPWGVSRDEALAAARVLQKVDNSFDTEMANRLPASTGKPGPFELPAENIERALEILDEVSLGPRLVPMLRHLTEHVNPKISSKAGLIVGKRVHNLVWVRRVLGERSNARLRANALETVWGMSSPMAIELFNECLFDWDNRVVGNAIVGLHCAKHPGANEAILRIAEDANPKLRMTAAWVTGRIADPTLLSVLHTLAKDPESDVRRAALRSLRSFRAARKIEEPSQAPSAPLETEGDDELPAERAAACAPAPALPVSSPLRRVTTSPLSEHLHG